MEEYQINAAKDAYEWYDQDTSCFQSEQAYCFCKKAPDNHEKLEECIYIWCKCLFQKRQYMMAIYLLNDFPTDRCKYLYAQCCIELNLLKEAESMLLSKQQKFDPSSIHKETNLTSLKLSDIPMGVHGIRLLGTIYHRNGQSEKAIKAYSIALENNNTLWSAYVNMQNFANNTTQKYTNSVTCTLFKYPEQQYIKPTKVSTVDRIDEITNKSLIEEDCVQLQKIAVAWAAGRQYQCAKSNQEQQSLPRHLFTTGQLWSMVALNYFEIGNFAASEAHFLNSRACLPKRLDFLDIYSTVLWQQNRRCELAILAQQVIEIDRLSPITWIVVGNCQSQEKDAKSAIEFLNRAIQINPYHSYAYTLLGHEYMIIQNYSKSIECYRKATLYSPIQYRAWYGLASLYYKQERYEQARYYIAYALEINTKSCILWIFSAIVLYTCGETQLALNCLHHANQVDSNNPLPQFQRAIILYDEKRYEEALQVLLTVFHLTPNEANVHFLLGNIYRQLNNPLSALKHLYHALDIDKKNSTLIQDVIELTKETLENDSLASDSVQFKST